MKEHCLMATQRIHKLRRTIQRSKPRVDKPFQYWGMDMTKFMLPPVGWVYLMIVLDWYTNEIVGWELSLRCKTGDWKKALNRGLNRGFRRSQRKVFETRK